MADCRLLILLEVLNPCSSFPRFSVGMNGKRIRQYLTHEKFVKCLHLTIEQYPSGSVLKIPHKKLESSFPLALAHTQSSIPAGLRTFPPSPPSFKSLAMLSRICPRSESTYLVRNYSEMESAYIVFAVCHLPVIVTFSRFTPKSPVIRMLSITSCGFPTIAQISKPRGSSNILFGLTTFGVCDQFNFLAANSNVAGPTIYSRFGAFVVLQHWSENHCHE